MWREMGAVLAALLATSSGAVALPVVQYTVDDLGGGLFQYDLMVDNSGGGEDLSGLDVLHAGSVFGLGASSTIGAPSGWMSFLPVPSLIDDLDYFSLSPIHDIPIDGTLGGFSFRSTTDPGTLTGDEFAVEGIGADSASQISLGVAQRLPEPSLALLFGAGGFGLRVARRLGSPKP